MKNCKHEYKLSYTNGTFRKLDKVSVVKRCKKCKHEIVIKGEDLPPKEIGELYKKEIKVRKRSDEMHRLNWKVLRIIEDIDGTKNNVSLSDELEAYIKDNKLENVIAHTRVDDHMFMGADLFLVPHYFTNDTGKQENWGTTCYLFKQYDEKPYEFFMYPHHAKSLFDALKKQFKLK